MNSLLSFLLRSGGGILRESAEVLIGQALVRAATRRLKGILLFYAMLSMFALAALVFFYVLLYRWLSLRLDETSAAAILCGANLLLVALMLIGRALIKPKALTLSKSPIVEMIRSHTEGLGSSKGSFDSGVEIGKHIRKAAPQIAIAAAVLGLVIGVRPQILGLFRRRKPPAN